MVLRIKLAVGLSADRALCLVLAGRRPAGAVFGFGAGAAVHRAFTGVRAVAVGYPFTVGMPVVYRYGHFGGVARLIGDDDSLLAVRRREDKAAVFVKRDLRAVYGDGVYILLVNGERLCLAIGLAVLNAGDNGDCSVKHDAVCVNVGSVSAGIGQFCINNILVIGIDTERCGICRKGHSRKFRFGKRLFAQQVFNCHRLAAVVSGRNSYRLRILKEQTEGDGVEERLPAVFADLDFAGGLFAVFPLCGDCDAFGGHGRGNRLIPTDEGITLSCRVGRRGNLRAVLLRDGRDGAAAAGVKGDGVLVDPPLRRDGQVFGGHGGGNRLIPTDEGITLSCRVGRCGNLRAVVLRDGRDGAAAVGVKGDGVLIYGPSGRQGHVLRHSGVEVILRIVQIPVRELITLSAGYIRLNSFLARLDDLRGIGSTQSPVSIGHGGGGDVGLRGVGRVVDHIAGIDGLTAELGVLVHGQPAIVCAAGDMALRGDRAVERAAGEVAAEFLPRCAHVPIRVRHGDAAMENTAPYVALAGDVAGKDRGRLPVRVVDGVGGLYGV